MWYFPTNDGKNQAISEKLVKFNSDTLTLTIPPVRQVEKIGTYNLAVRAE